MQCCLIEGHEQHAGNGMSHATVWQVRSAVLSCTVSGYLVQSVEYEGMKWTLWDRWVLEGDLTVQQVLDWFAVSSDVVGTCKL